MQPNTPTPPTDLSDSESRRYRLTCAVSGRRAEFDATPITLPYAIQDAGLFGGPMPETCAALAASILADPAHDTLYALWALERL